MRQALELALQFIESNADSDSERELVATIKEALAQPDQDQDEVDIRSLLYQRIHELETQLAQPKQEPVGEAYLCDECLTPFNDAWECPSCGHNMAVKEPVYTTPPQHKPLTDEQLKPLIQKAMMYYGHNPEHWTVTAGAGFCILARAIEAAHGIKE